MKRWLWRVALRTLERLVRLGRRLRRAWRGKEPPRVTLGRMSVTNQRATCPGPLVESTPGTGECSRGEECEVLALQHDYLSYRNAHMRVTTEWQQRRD